MKAIDPQSDSGYVLMKAASPILFSFDETELRIAAFRIVFPRTHPVVKWNDTGKLLIKKGELWHWTGFQVLNIPVIGD